MPHIFLNRPRVYDLIGTDPNPRSHFRWETINAITYEIGGLVFIFGSICFFPELSTWADIGAWTFLVGSLLYLLVTGHDLAEVLRTLRRSSALPTLRTQLEFWAAVCYVVGSLLFIFGSLFFLSVIGLLMTGAWCFILGSILFVAGAIINVLQIVQSPDIATLQLANLTAITFIVGSVLFVVASIPYLWTFSTEDDRLEVDEFLAWQYLAGSVLFFVGGLFNYWRAYRVIARLLGRATAPLPPILRSDIAQGDLPGPKGD